jgi:hypothetical protein
MGGCDKRKLRADKARLSTDTRRDADAPALLSGGGLLSDLVGRLCAWGEGEEGSLSGIGMPLRPLSVTVILNCSMLVRLSLVSKQCKGEPPDNENQIEL